MDLYSLIRPMLFVLDAERAHRLCLSLLHYVPSNLVAPAKQQSISAIGLEFPHPIGLAAGFDKNGEHLDALAKLGFSFIELGTVTPRAQIGNPKPRLFRIPSARAIINRMGFNNLGVDALLDNIQKANYRGILGINIGKNKDTPLNQAYEDYVYCLRKIYTKASYITINISSPNTPELRQLQHVDYFTDLIRVLCTEQQKLSDIHRHEVPLLVKISPDESDETLKMMAEVMLAFKIKGIIATNTTCARDEIHQLPHHDEAGGLSGYPLLARSNRCLHVLKQAVGDAMTLIGVGGVDSAATAQQKIEAGASLVQIYTGLIYQGPNLVKKIMDELS
jgi:dihydroorotate dehydrogenase